MTGSSCRRSSKERDSASWGGRTLYTWTADGRQLARQPNPDHLLDYQDGAYLGNGKQHTTLAIRRSAS